MVEEWEQVVVFLLEVPPGGTAEVRAALGLPGPDPDGAADDDELAPGDLVEVSSLGRVRSADPNAHLRALLALLAPSADRVRALAARGRAWFEVPRYTRTGPPLAPDVVAAVAALGAEVAWVAAHDDGPGSGAPAA